MRTNAVLWIVQVLLAVLFLFAGVMKLILPAEALAGSIHLPVEFLRFIGVCEGLGALGLILPGLLRIHRELTPLAAAGLVIIMIGATTITAAGGSVAGAAFPFGVGILCGAVAGRRWRQLPANRPLRLALSR